ncbi:hypothetical protein [Pontibacter actiniarum]|uniref:Uncharacterized protein n=1 Tax=Pontibacter actiniarum TaxID=323450 RepID=A0A1X9YYV2_9BACT|nr:hypothetical protein [Pontibacter actiniarum]ARS38068.1 hypothetical protein CA264_21200 [Pontibacter actiniarum]
MNPKQAERLQKKISDIRRALAAEKRKFGAYDDSRGLRYLPTKYYLQLGDYRGGLTYLRWFDKNFPDDGGFPDFLFEWTVILFKSGKLKEAAQKAFETFCANTYLFDRFFGRPVVPIDKYEGSNLATPSFTEHFPYSSGQAELADFSVWLENLALSEDFTYRTSRYIEVYKRLKTEKDREARFELLMQARQLGKGQ